MYLAVLDFLNAWLGDNSIQLFGSQANCLSNRRGALSKSRTHLFLNKFDLAVHIEYTHLRLYVCVYIYICIARRACTCICTIHLQFKNKINTASLFLLFLLLLRCQLSHSLVAEFLPDNFIHTNNTSTHCLIKYKHLCKCICCFYFRSTATFKTISNQKSSTY